MPEGTTWPTAWPSPRCRKCGRSRVSRGVRLRARPRDASHRPKALILSTSSRVPSAKPATSARAARPLPLPGNTHLGPRSALSFLRGPGRPDRRGTRPSSVIHELLRHLERQSQGQADANAWIRKEPLRRFEGLNRFTAPVPSIAAQQEARELRAPRVVPDTQWPRRNNDLGSPLAARRPYRDWLGLCPPYRPQSKTVEPSTRLIEVSLREIRQFLECPLQS